MDISTAYNRKRKLAKLFLVSKNLIQQFGMRFFLRIAFEEISKQKLKMFLPDTSEKLHFVNISNDYEMFKQKHRIFDLTSKRKELSELSILPQFTFILLVDKFSNIDNIKQIIKSISNQIFENYDLQILNCSKNIINLNDFKNELDLNRIQIINKKSEHIKLNEIISQVKGQFIAFLDTSVILQNNLLYQIVMELNKNPNSDIFYTDEDTRNANNKRVKPFFKPDFSPYLLSSLNYIGRFCVIKKTILDQIGEFEFKIHHNFVYNLLLRCSEITIHFSHIPLPLFSAAHKDNDFFKYDKSYISNHLKRLGINANVKNGLFSNTYRVNYKLEAEPKVSIIIPTKNKKNLLKRCIDSIEKKTNYKNLEIIIIDNDSDDIKTINYLKSLPYQIIQYNEPFNFSKMNNLAVSKAKGDYILFLNDDTAALDSDWLTEMVSICQQNNVGAVGPKLIHSNKTIQHAGAVFLKTGSGFHPFQHVSQKASGYFNLINVIRDFSAVTGACLLTKKEIFDKIEGFDDDFDLYYGDSDLCLRIRNLGYHVVYTPYAKLLHEGSASIRKHSDAFFPVENHYNFIKKWPFLNNGDPFYNPNLGWDYSINSM